MPESEEPRRSLSPSSGRWFAVRVRHQHEKTVLSHLAAFQLESFLPLYPSRRKWHDRVKELELPLFPGYVFCRCSPDERVPVLRIPGVRGIVSFASRPVPIPDAEIDAVRRMVASGLPVEPWPFLKKGTVVRIKSGSLEGLEGLLVQIKNRWRVVVSVNLLKRSVAVEIDRDAVTPVTTPRGKVGRPSGRAGL